MDRYRGYEKILLEQLHDIKATNKKIVLFGTSEMALYAKKALDYLNIEVECFMDNDTKKINTKFESIQVLAPKEAKEKSNNLKIFICSFNRTNIKHIYKELSELGYDDINNCDMLFYVYQIYVMQRPILSSEFANTINILNNPDGKLIAGGGASNIPIIITEKCTLRCRDCGVFMPYYKNPQNYDKHMIINSIKAFSECVDVIETINIIGGETFLHPDLAEICEEISKINNIFKIIIITNGTIVPRDEVLLSLKKVVVSVNISNYGKLSYKKNELFNKFNKCDIPCFSFDDIVEWSKVYPPKKHNRTDAENAYIHNNCRWACFLSKIINGEFHICDFSAGLSPFKIIPDNEMDYVDLLSKEVSTEEKRERIFNLLSRRSFLKACDYCGHYKEDFAPRAVQVKEVLNFEME